MKPMNGYKNYRLVSIYLLMVFVNWMYVYWIRSEANIVESSYFLLMPLFGYFYFTFAFISAYFIYTLSRIGFSIGCCVLTCAMITDVISYNIVNMPGLIYEAMVITLVVMNVAVICLLAASQSTCKKE